MNNWIRMLNGIADSWSSAMWLVVWQSAALAALIWIAAAFLRKAPPALRFWLWMLVPLRLIVMPLLTITLPLLPPAVPEDGIRVSPPISVQHPSAGVESPMSVPFGAGVAEVVTASPSPTPGPVVPASIKSVSIPSVRLSTNAWLLLAWLAGTVFFAVRLIRGARQMHRYVNRAPPLSDSALLDAAERIARRLGLTRVPSIRVTNEAISPLVAGLLRPTVLVPSILLKQAQPSEIEAILSHEFAHVSRHDPLLGWALGFCETFYFFHPAFHLAKRACMREREQACDEVVLAQGQAAPQAYVNMLITAAATCQLLKNWIAPSAVVAESFGDLKRRITRICSCMTPRARLSRTSLASLALAAIVSLPGIVLTTRSIAQPAAHVAASQPAQDWSAAPAPLGMVVDAAGLPVPNAKVLLYRMKSHWGLGNGVLETVSTSSDGRFAFQHRLTFETPDGSDYTEHYLLFATHPKYALGYHKIVSGQALDRYQITLTAPTTRELTVTDMKDKPLPGARVWVYEGGDPENKLPSLQDYFYITDDLGIASATTDPNGKATLTNLPNVGCSFSAKLKGYAQGLAFPGGKQIRLSRGTTVTGSVKTEHGKPVSGAIVTLDARWMSNAFRVKTGEDGSFRLEDLPARGWDTSPWGDSGGGSGVYSVTLRHDAFTCEQREVKLEPGQPLDGLNLTAVSGTRLRITVLELGTDRPIRGYRVQGRTASGGIDGYTAADGTIERLVLPGLANLWLVTPPAGMYFTQDNGPHDVKVDVEGETQEVKLHATSKTGELSRLRGRVLLPDGRPAAGVTLRVTSATHYAMGNGGEVRARSNDDGNFELARVPVGLKMGFYGQTDDLKYAFATTNTLAAGETDLSEPWTMQATQEAQVDFQDEQGKPRANLQLRLSPVVDSQTFYQIERTAKTNDAGKLKINGILPGLKYHMTETRPTDRREVAQASPPAEQTLELIPKERASSEQKAATATLSDRIAVLIAGPDGKAVPIDKITELSVFISDGRWMMSKPIEIRGRPGDGAVLIDREHVLLGKPGQRTEIKIVTDKGQSILATGKFPEDGSNRFLFTTQQTVSVVIPKRHTLKGQVTDDQGRPAAGAWVKLTNRDILPAPMPVAIEPEGGCFYTSEYALAKTNAKGRFEFVGLKEGKTDVRIQLEGRRTALLQSIPTDMPELKIAMLKPAAYSFSGQVVDPQGKPVQDAEVTWIERSHQIPSPREPRIITLRTRADGAFRLPDSLQPLDGLMPMSRNLIVRKHGYGLWGREIDGTGAEPDVKVALAPAASISGRVVGPDGTPVAGAELVIWSLRDRKGSSAIDLHYMSVEQLAPRVRTDALGKFTFAGLAPGCAVSINTSATGYALERQFDVEVGTSDLEIRMDREAILRGRVVNAESNAPVAGMMLSTQGSKTANWAETRTDSQGRFELRGLKAEPLNILPMIEDSRPGQAPVWTAAAIEIHQLDPGQTRDDLKMVVTQGALVRGHVADAEGHPLKGIDIAFYSAARPRSGAACQVTHTAQDGNWSYRFPPGEVYVYIRTNIADARWDRHDHTLRVKEGQTTEKIDFTLDRAVPQGSVYR